jgi:two-component system sensor histidine kinase UhpB
VLQTPSRLSFDGLSEQAYYPSFRMRKGAGVCALRLMKIMNFATGVGQSLQKPGRGKTRPMSLRLQINIAITVLMSLFIGTLVIVEIEAASRSVAEEMEASSRVAGHLLQGITKIDQGGDPAWIRAFLTRLGRVRANEIELVAADGSVIYASPPPTYKAGRDAPAWFARLVAPNTPMRMIPLQEGTLRVTPNASRAILDAWDNLYRFAVICGVFLVVANVVVFWLAGRAVAPLERIAEALSRVERGQLDTRLPLLRGREAHQIGESFNRMATAVEETVRIRELAERARLQLASGRALAREVQARMEEERRLLARELHDELGQTVTAIRSIVASIEPGALTPDAAKRIKMIEELALRLHEGVRDLVPRLRPLVLDELGLADALRDLVDEYRAHHGGLAIEFATSGGIGAISGEQAIALYRVVQESLTNVVRHAQASRCVIALAAGNDELSLTVADDGRGTMEADLATPGRFGVRGMRERIESLGGTVSFAPSHLGGLAVQVRLPLAADMET